MWRTTGFDLLHRLPTADESQISLKQLTSNIDGAGRCQLPVISKHVLFHQYKSIFVQCSHVQFYVRAYVWKCRYMYWIWSMGIRIRKRKKMYHSCKSVTGRICLDKAKELRKKEELIEDPIYLRKLVKIARFLDHSAILLPNVVSRQPK